MKRGVVNLIGALILVAVVIGAGIALAMHASYLMRFEQTNRVITRFSRASMINERLFSVEVVLENRGTVPVCVKSQLLTVFFTNGTGYVLNVSSYSPELVLPSSSTGTYTLDVYSPASLNETLILLHLDIYVCMRVSSCFCNGTRAYSDTVPLSARYQR